MMAVDKKDWQKKGLFCPPRDPPRARRVPIIHVQSPHTSISKPPQAAIEAVWSIKKASILIKKHEKSQQCQTFIPRKHQKTQKKFYIGHLSGINGLHCAQ